MTKDDDKSGGRIGNYLIKTGAIEESKLTDFLSRQYGVPVVNPRDIQLAAEAIKLVPRATCLEHLLIPVNRAGTALIVAMSDPSDTIAVDAIGTLTGYTIEIVVASEVAIREAIERHYPSAKA